MSTSAVPGRGHVGPIHNIMRDPLEHAVWAHHWPKIAEWAWRPYCRDLAHVLSVRAAACLFPTGGADQRMERARRWRAAQEFFMGATEYRSNGMIRNRLLELGDAEGASRIQELADRVGAILEANERQEEQIRSGLKELMRDGGLPTLLSDERYMANRSGEQYGDAHVPFTIAQTSLIGPAPLAVKDIHAQRTAGDGLRLLVDMYPPRVTDKYWDLYDQRLDEGLPSRRLFEWFGHSPDRWPEFQQYHHRQLHAEHRKMVKLLNILSKGPSTLLHLQRGEHSIARSLHNYLMEHYPHVFTRAEP